MFRLNQHSRSAVPGLEVGTSGIRSSIINNSTASFDQMIQNYHKMYLGHQVNCSFSKMNVTVLHKRSVAMCLLLKLIKILTLHVKDQLGSVVVINPFELGGSLMYRYS